MRDILSKEDQDRRSPSHDLSSNAPVDNAGLGTYANKKAIWIDIQYENAECTGMLLPNLSTEDDLDLPNQTWAASSGQVVPEHFLQLPLLLLRMPAPLKTIVIEWLCSVFDCRVTSLTLGTRSLVSILETWLRDAVFPSRGAAGKDIVLTLGFSLPQLQEAPEDDDEEPEKVQVGIRSLDITIAAADVQRFIEAGEAMADESTQAEPTPWTGDAKTRKRLAGGNDEDGWSWKRPQNQRQTRSQIEDPGADEEVKQPFVDAVARYLHSHLALNLFHPSVRVQKVATPGFVLTESRVKVFGTEDARTVRVLLGNVTARSLGPELANVF